MKKKNTWKMAHTSYNIYVSFIIRYTKRILKYTCKICILFVNIKTDLRLSWEKKTLEKFVIFLPMTDFNIQDVISFHIKVDVLHITCTEYFIIQNLLELIINTYIYISQSTCCVRIQQISKYDCVKVIVLCAYIVYLVHKFHLWLLYLRHFSFLCKK